MNHFRIETVTDANLGMWHYVVRLDTNETVGHAYKDFAKAETALAGYESAGPFPNGIRPTYRK